MSEIKDRQKLSWEAMFYSIQRIDLLIISICGAGIYICFESVKFFSSKCLDIHFLIRISGVFFLLGIIINFISQFLGYEANKHDYLMCQAEIDAGNKISESERVTIDKHDDTSEKYSKWTTRFNYGSLAFMLLGVSSITIYFLFIF